MRLKGYSKKKFSRILDNKIIRLKMIDYIIKMLSQTVKENILFYQEMNGRIA